MSRILSLAFLLVAALSFSGCLTTQVGGPGAIVAMNTNVTAITAAANSVFAQSGYSMGPGNYPTSISFEKPAGAFGQAMWGSYDNKQTIRVKVKMIPVAGTSNYQLTAHAYSVSSAGEAGFEDSRQIALFNGQFTPLLRKIQVLASGAGQ